MTPGQVIEQLAEHAYECGIDPLKFAAAVVEVVTEDCLGLACRDPRTVLLGRRIIGAMLEAGWQPPGGTETP